MIERFPIHATVAAADLGRAKAWYQQKLGMEPAKEEGLGAWYRFAGDTWLLVYQTDQAGTAQNTQAGWTVTDIEAVMADLRGRGVEFEEYDMGEMKTVDGVLAMGPYKAAWFKDSEGNIFELSQTP